MTQILVVFMKMFKKSRDENEQAADAEKKKLEKEALKEQVAASSSGKKGVGDSDRVKLNFLNQLHAVWISSNRPKLILLHELPESVKNFFWW